MFRFKVSLNPCSNGMTIELKAKTFNFKNMS